MRKEIAAHNMRYTLLKRMAMTILLLGLASFWVIGQQAGSLTLRGRIIDPTDGKPMQGAVVEVAGKTNSRVLTNKAGDFVLQANIGDTLVVSYVGYETRRELVTDGEELTLELKPDPKSMQGVVVIGYGTVRKGDLTGSVGQVEMKDFEKAPVGQIGDALAGRVAGVNASASDGQPGSDINIIIRGSNSLTQSNSPLYVIDGFPIENPSPGSLNPSDIASITILKDASSTAIYGARAANGVVVIETKRGKIGKPEVTINSSIGYQNDKQRMEVMNPYEFVKYQYEFNPVSTTNTYLANGETLESYRDSAGINWQDEVLRKGRMQIHNVAVRGGNRGTRYAFSGSLFDQEGIIINSGFRRYQARLTLDQDLSEKFKFGFTANYSHTRNFGERIADAQSPSISSSTWFRVWGFRPVAGTGSNLLDAISDPAGADSDGERLNPRITLENNNIRRENSNLTSNAFLSYDITPKIRVKVLGALDTRKFTDKAFYNTRTPQGSPVSANNIRGVNGNIRFRDLMTWTNENTITYQEKIGSKHNLNVLLGNTLQESRTESFGFASEQLPNEPLGIYGLDQGIPYDPIATESSNSLVSFFSRVNYSFDSRFLFTFTYRADASSKFANPWGYFPSGAVAWNLHNENFMKSLPAISQLKLRATYGVSGNNRIGDFDRLAILNLSTNGYSFNNSTPISSVVPGSIANEGLRWEVTKQLDLGFDLGLFRNRVELTVDYYKKKTTDLLLNADLSPSLGFSSAIKNVGSLQNEGLEIAINSVNINNRDFQWTSSFNISFNRNKILSLNEGQTSLANRVNFESQFSAPLYISEIGRSAGMFYGLVYEGLYQLSDFDNPAPGVYILKAAIPTNGTARENIRPGDIKYRDINGDGTVDNFDLTVIGRGLPIHIGGFTNNFTYRNLTLSVFLQWSYGNDIYNANRLPLEGNSNGRQNLNQFASYSDRWSFDNQDAKNFRVGGGGPTGRHSSRVLEDGSYLRFKTVSLSYALPDSWLKRIKLRSLSFNIAAQNLITITNYSGMDPEVSVRNSILTPGFDYSAYPMARTVVFGINAGF